MYALRQRVLAHAARHAEELRLAALGHRCGYHRTDLSYRKHDVMRRRLLT